MKAKSDSFGVMYLLLIALLLCLLFMGICFSNLVHFYVEDTYATQLNSSVLFGYEYAHSISWLIIITPLFIILQLYQWFLIKKRPQFLEQKGRNVLLLIMLVIYSVVAVYYLVGAVYSFFGGYSEVGGLWRVAVTIFTLGLGVLYCAFELSGRSVLLSLGYKWALMAVVFFSVIISICITLSQASPTYIREMRSDHHKVLDLQELNASIYEYFKAYNMPPPNLEELVHVGVLSHGRLEEELHDYTYKKISDNTFEICADFKHDSAKSRRLHRLHVKKHFYKAGHDCQRIHMKSADSAKKALSVELSPNINVAILKEGRY